MGSEDFFQKAQQGDAQVLAKLLEALRPMVLNYLYRRLGNLAEAEDLCQEVLLDFFSHHAEKPKGLGWTAWIFQRAVERLRFLVSERGPLSADVLEILQEGLLENPEKEQRLLENFSLREENYRVVDHLNFCFNLQLQTLFSPEQEIFVLHRLLNFPLEELPLLTGRTMAECEHLQQEAESQLSDALAMRCGLVNASGACTQCRDWGAWLSDEDAIEIQIKNLKFSFEAKVADNFEQRLQWIKSWNPMEMGARGFYQGLFDFLQKLLGR